MKGVLKALIAVVGLSAAGCASLTPFVLHPGTLSGTLADIPDRGSMPVPWNENYYFIGNTRVQPTRTVPETLLAELVGQDVIVTGKITGEKIVARGIEVKHK